MTPQAPTYEELLADLRRISEELDLPHGMIPNKGEFRRMRGLVEEAVRLQRLFDDAGQGEYNVLALVDHYQNEAIAAEEKLRAAEAQLGTTTRLLCRLCNSMGREAIAAHSPELAEWYDDNVTREAWRERAGAR